MSKKTAKLINPKVIFILLILATTCYEILNEPFRRTNLASLCFQVLTVFALPASLIVALVLTEMESKNKIEKPKEIKQFSIYDIGSFGLGFMSVFVLFQTKFLNHSHYLLAILSVLVIVIILITNAVQGGAKLL